VTYKSYNIKSKNTTAKLGIILDGPDDELDVCAVLSTSGKIITIHFGNIKRIF
jgi:hypothetical protein